MKRSLAISLLITAGLVALFYAGVWVLPHFIHWIAARSLYNYRDLAEQAVARGDYDRAVEILQRASRELPFRDIYFERPEYMYDWIGRIRKQQGGKEAESLEAFLQAQKSYFVNITLRGYFPPPQLIKNIIDGYFETNNPAGAFEEARVAFAFYPMLKDTLLEPFTKRFAASPVIKRDAGLLASLAGRIPEAQTWLNAALTANPRLPGVHFGLGRLAEDLKATETAIREYRAELAVNPCAENALMRLIALYRRAGKDTSSLTVQLETMHSRAVAAELPPTPSQPLASLFGINSKAEFAFTLPDSGTVVLNICGHSTPCFGLYGWLEVTLDGRHVQNLYVSAPEPEVFPIQLENVPAGRHTLRLEALSDAQDGTHDRNTFIHSIRVYRFTGKP